MARPLITKFKHWSSRRKGVKSRFHRDLQPPALQREDVAGPITQRKIKRGDVSQELRLKYYPSIDIEYDDLFAGYIEADLEDAEKILYNMGYRNNPTAYVEVSEKHGPDDGSYAKQVITESGAGSRRQFVHNYPTIFRREKRQVHVCVFVVDGRVEFLAHEERSAWLQPARHVGINDANARIGVREFRDDWYDNFDEELEGKDQVNWPTTH